MRRPTCPRGGLDALGLQELLLALLGGRLPGRLRPVELRCRVELRALQHLEPLLGLAQPPARGAPLLGGGRL
eukprot:10150893-Lingulodinium_polyedra.AAC.1